MSERETVKGKDFWGRPVEKVYQDGKLVAKTESWENKQWFGGPVTQHERTTRYDDPPERSRPRDDYDDDSSSYSGSSSSSSSGSGGCLGIVAIVVILGVIGSMKNQPDNRVEAPYDAAAVADAAADAAVADAAANDAISLGGAAVAYEDLTPEERAVVDAAAEPPRPPAPSTPSAMLGFPAEVLERRLAVPRGMLPFSEVFDERYTEMTRALPPAERPGFEKATRDWAAAMRGVCAGDHGCLVAALYDRVEFMKGEAAKLKQAGGWAELAFPAKLSQMMLGRSDGSRPIGEDFDDHYGRLVARLWPEERRAFQLQTRQWRDAAIAECGASTACLFTKVWERIQFMKADLARIESNDRAQ